MATIIQASAIVDAGAVLGENCRVWHFVHISSGARIGDNCSFGQNVYVGNDVQIGNNVKIQNNVSVYDAVTLADDVFCGPSMVLPTFTTLGPPSVVSMNTDGPSYGAARPWVRIARSCAALPSASTPSLLLEQL